MAEAYSKNVGIAINNILLGKPKRTLREKRLIRKNPYGDYDKDKIINIADCSPYNKNKDVWYKPWTWFKPAPKPSYVIETGGTPVGQTRTTAGGTVSTPGTPAQPGISRGYGKGTTTSLGVTTPTIIGKGIIKGGGGGSYNPSTGVYTSSTGEQQSMAQAPSGAIITTVPSGVTTTPPDKLQLGASVVSAYQPKTTAEIAATKKLETESKLRKIWQKSTGWISEGAKRLSLGKVTEYVTAPRDVLIDVFTGQKQKEEYIPTPEELIAKKRKESTSYYTRPISIGGDILTAGSIYTTPLTAGEKLTSEITQENVYATAQAENTAKNIVEDYGMKTQQDLNLKFEEIQKDYDTGKINYETATSQLEKEQDKIVQQYTNLSNTKINKELKGIKDLSAIKRKAIENTYKSAVALSFGQKVISGGLATASWAIPIAGSIFKTADITKMAISAPELTSSLYESPIGTLGEISPYILGGVAGGLITGGIKSSITNAKLKADALAKQKNLKLETSNSISVGNAVKIRTNPDGSSVWNVKVKSVSKIINKKTGKVLDTTKAVSIVKAVTSPTGEGAIKSIVDAWSLELRRGGVRFYKEGNKITLKGGLGKTTGELLFKPAEITGKPLIQPTNLENIFRGWGKFETKTGKLKVKVTEKEVSIKATLTNIPQYSSLSNVISKIKESYPEVKIIKTGGNSIKIKGTESIIQSLIKSDVYRNFVKVKGYTRTVFGREIPTGITIEKIKPYARKPAVEPKPFRDLTKGYLKSFTPQQFILDTTGQKFVKPSLAKLTLKQLSQKQAAEVSAQAATAARATSVAQLLVEGIKTKAGKFTPVKTFQVTDILTGFGGVAVTKKKVKVEAKENIATRLSNALIGVSKVKVKEKQKEALYPLNIQNINTLLGGRQISRPKQKIITKQAQQEQQKQKLNLLTGQIIPIRQISPRIKTPVFPEPKIPVYFKYEKIKETQQQKRKQLSYEKQMAKQAREYASSVSAFQLGLYAPKGFKPKRQKFTGLEIRGMLQKEQGGKYKYVNPMQFL